MPNQATPAPATTQVSEVPNPETTANNNATTPPPSQVIHDKNSSNGPLPPPSVRPAPTFQEFAMSEKSTGEPAPLKPESSILNSEIKQLNPEEFEQNIITAEKETASMQQRLWLPKQLRQSLQRFAAEIINTKQTWEETGAILDCEDLKIHSPAGTIQSPTTSRSTHVLRKKHIKTTHDVRPANLLEEDSKTAPGPGANAEVSNSEYQTSP
ncbi:hypothetical protein VP01_113g9 [Puccinia sorghi]|uniref:Uncharacterized protein n=1 Tax=Puccinia sorghi TaxID=27349 RepID=A0A0L6VRX9_9BASI|nr:hypothetical protein VP01_113g9 [Puccinia sorghi]